MNRFVLILLLLCNLAFAESREINDYHWEGVERVVAIGDLHGDYNNYLEVLKLAGLIDKKASGPAVKPTWCKREISRIVGRTRP